MSKQKPKTRKARKPAAKPTKPQVMEYSDLSPDEKWERDYYGALFAIRDDSSEFVALTRAVHAAKIIRNRLRSAAAVNEILADRTPHINGQAADVEWVKGQIRESQEALGTLLHCMNLGLKEVEQMARRLRRKAG